MMKYQPKKRKRIQKNNNNNNKEKEVPSDAQRRCSWDSQKGKEEEKIDFHTKKKVKREK